MKLLSVDVIALTAVFEPLLKINKMFHAEGSNDERQLIGTDFDLVETDDFTKPPLFDALNAVLVGLKYEQLPLTSAPNWYFEPDQLYYKKKLAEKTCHLFINHGVITLLEEYTDEQN